MCNEAVNTSLSAIQLVSECYKTQEMCDKAVSEDLFMLKYCLDRYKTEQMCDKAVDEILITLKFVPDWFVTSAVIKNFHNALFTDDDIFFLDAHSANVIFSGDLISILSVNQNNINLNDVIF